MKSNPLKPECRSDQSSIVLWLVLFGTLLGTSSYFFTSVYRTFSWDTVFASAAMLIRSGVIVTVGLGLEALFLRAKDGYFTLTKCRRAVLHTFWVAVMLLSVSLVADALNVAFAGYHLTTSIRILFSDGPAGVGQVVQASGISTKSFLIGGIALIGGIGIAIYLSKWSRRLSSRFGILVTRRTAFRTLFAAIGVLAILEVLSVQVRNPYLWQRELQRVPLAFSLIEPRAELASLRARVKPLNVENSDETIGPLTTNRPLPDVFIVLVESLRKDVVTTDIMPHFSAFGRSAWTFEHPTTTGNVTHFSWYGLLSSRHPIYYDVAKANARASGSLPLKRLRQAGYRIHLLATPDTRYQHLDSILFGASDPTGRGSLIDVRYRPVTGSIAERDRSVIVELERQLRTTPRGGHVYLIALDSTHFDYVWGSEFAPQFVPFAKTIPITHDYVHDFRARRLVINRYKNSVAWLDYLLGRAIAAIESTERLEDSIVVITGDHGESFWEHETGTHGSHLTREQVEIGFALRFPGRAARHFNTVFSLIDVMPTVLDELGLSSAGLDGTPLRARDGSTAALTFQGWNERAYHFSLTMPNRRMRFKLDQAEPLRSQRLILGDVTDLEDVSLIEGEQRSIDGSYHRALCELPAILAELPFMEL